ncbi:putative RWP-RK domain-containing protein [Plasmopara halstedii]
MFDHKVDIWNNVTDPASSVLPAVTLQRKRAILLSTVLDRQTFPVSNMARTFVIIQLTARTRIMSTYSYFPHLPTREIHRIPPQQHEFDGLSLTPKYLSRERTALPPLNVLPSRVHATFSYAQSRFPAMMSPAAMPLASCTHSPAKKRVRAVVNASKSITLEMLRPHFEKPLAEVANTFGICMTLMKKICRKNGVPRWPHRQIRGLRKSIWSIKKALRCCESEFQRRSYNDHLLKQQSKLKTILKGPASPSSKAAFELMLSEPCSPINEVENVNVDEKIEILEVPAVSPATQFHVPGLQISQKQINSALPKLPSIASLLMKNEMRCRNYSY